MAEDRNSLLQFLTRNYSTDELKTLCFQLFVDFDNLAGDTKSAKARELILHLERADRMSDLGPILGRDKPIAYRREFTKDPPIPRIPPRRNRDMNQVFLSHAQEDEAIARRIAADLQAEGWTVWMAPDSIMPGETWVEAINRGLEESGFYLLVQTPAAVASRWVVTETNVAIGLEHQHLMRFIPLDVSPSRPPPLWTAYQNVPFRDNYLRGLEHLLARLNGRSPRPWPSAGAGVKGTGNGDNVTQSDASRIFTNRLLHDRTRIELVRVPAGNFLFGTNSPEADNECTQRTIHLHEFWIASNPVTNAQFAKFVEATRYTTTAETTGFSRVWIGGRWVEVEGAYWKRPEGSRDNIENRPHHPVVCVSWFDAQAYCEWAGLRLPTEKEWEKAARGTDGRIYPWGNENPRHQRANFGMRPGHPTPAGQYSPAGDSPYGVSDLAGNVWEWTSSWFESRAAKSKPTKVVRGGAWPSEPLNLRATYRLDVDPSLRFNTVGFRVSAHLGDPGF